MSRGKRVNRQSKRRAEELKSEIPIRQAFMKGKTVCEAKGAGAPGDCFGPLQCHEPWSRARGGPTDDPRNFRCVCSTHNTNISQDVATMRWAWASEFLVHSWEGAEWLERKSV